MRHTKEYKNRYVIVVGVCSGQQWSTYKYQVFTNRSLHLHYTSLWNRVLVVNAGDIRLVPYSFYRLWNSTLLYQVYKRPSMDLYDSAHAFLAYPQPIQSDLRFLIYCWKIRSILKITDFCRVTPCSLTEIYWGSRKYTVSSALKLDQVSYLFREYRWSFVRLQSVIGLHWVFRNSILDT